MTQLKQLAKAEKLFTLKLFWKMMVTANRDNREVWYKRKLVNMSGRSELSRFGKNN